MKKYVIFILICILSLLSFSDDLFIFRNTGIISKDYPWTDEVKIPLEKNENVVFIENADFYKISLSNLNDINFKIIGNSNDLKNSVGSRITMINSNPIILKDVLNLNYIYFFNSYLNLWCRTESTNLDSLLNHKLLYAKNVKGEVMLSKPLSWDLFYSLKDNGDLYVTYTINGNIKASYNTILIDETFNLNNSNKLNNDLGYTKSMAFESVQYVPQIENDSAIINFGEIKPFNGEFSKVIKLGTIKNYEDINFLNINFYSNSFDNRYLNIIREFENTKENGIGVPLIKGNIYIFTKKENKEFIQKVATLSKANENETAEIFLGQSWNSTAKLKVLNETRTKNYIDKTFNINVKGNGKTEIEISGQSLNLLNIKGNYIKKDVYSDKIIIYIQGTQNLELTIRSNIK
jgi:hypothetical protein